MTRWFGPTVLQFTPPSWHQSRFQTKKTSSVDKHRKVRQYRLLYELAHGSTCTVHLALDTKTKKLCAIKEMDGTKLQRQLCMDWLQSRHPKNQQQQQQQQQQSDNHKRRRIDSPSTPASLPCAESNLLQSLHHDNIIEWLDCFEDNKNVYLVTEWIDGSVLVDLHDGDDTLAYDDRQHGSPLDASTCHSVFLQLVAILDYLHQENVIHGDVKPDNILLTLDNQIKLIDFGSAFHLNSLDKTSTAFQRQRTPAFTPPECINNKIDITPATRKSYETAGDIWCLGMTLYCMVYGKLPYHLDQAPSHMDLYHLLSTCPSIPHAETTDPQLRHLIDQMLTVAPMDRITLDRIKCHPWYLGPTAT